MRNLITLTAEELTYINLILRDEYYYTTPLKSWTEVEYQLFSKSHAVFSGYGVIKVYKYLQSIGIEI